MEEDWIVAPGLALSEAAVVRLVLGLLQGIALYLLYQADDSKVWPATSGLVFAPMVMVAFFLPIIAAAGIGNMRRRTLLLWVAAAAVVLVGLAVHDIHRGADGLTLWFRGEPLAARAVPSPTLVICAMAGLFVMQALIVAGDADRRMIGFYPHHFDAAWKHGIQLALSAGFVAVFWLLLQLGAGLFQLIGITFVGRFIHHAWFVLPAVTIAFSCALHVTDVRPGIVRGMRTLMLALLAWLLPMMALLVLGFLASLPFTGLAPLWSTRFATPLLLITALALIMLANAAYQDGQQEQPVPGVLRYAGSAAALMLTPLVAMAAYAVALRIDQYGWTTDRVIAVASVVVMACYAAGYLWAALKSGRWLWAMEITNVAAALLFVGALLALLTPLADPARIAVASQVARLESGATPAVKFDFAYLKFGGARYGQEALARLGATEQGADAAEIRRRANLAMKQQYRYQSPTDMPTGDNIAANVAVFPAGRSLPESFLRQDWLTAPQRWLLPQCLVSTLRKCDAYLLDLDGSGQEQIVLVDAVLQQGAVMQAAADGTWRLAGTLSHEIKCKGVLDALRAGSFTLARSGWSDIEVAGVRLQMHAAEPTEAPRCP